MIAIQIESSVGRCESCRRFRNNMEWKVDEKVVCLECFSVFKGNKQLDEIISKVVEPKQKTTKSYKPRRYKPKPKDPNQYVRKQPDEARNSQVIITKLLDFIEQCVEPVPLKTILEAKIACKNTLNKYLREFVSNGKICVLELNKNHYIDAERYEQFKNFTNKKTEHKRVKLPDIILQTLKASDCSLTPSEIRQGQTWNERSVYPALRKLVAEKKVTSWVLSQKNNLCIYIDVERTSLFSEENDFGRANLLNTTKKKALSFINNRNQITYIKDIQEELKVDKSTASRIVENLRVEGLVVVEYGTSHNAARFIAPVGNKQLLEELKRITHDSTKNKLERFLAVNKTPTLREVYVAAGCGSGSSGTRAYVKRLLKELGYKELNQAGEIRYSL